ncbi:hypothetical protein [Sporocytophaga myxococcoides]|nr:hypothetical protein [Sporocytophaga myxococcoides]
MSASFITLHSVIIEKLILWSLHPSDLLFAVGEGVEPPRGS